MNSSCIDVLHILFNLASTKRYIEYISRKRCYPAIGILNHDAKYCEFIVGNKTKTI